MKTLALVTALALVGCAQPGPRPLYQWDGYQAALYEHLKANGGDPGTQIAKLEAQVQKNAAGGMANPPGLRAHLGLLHAKMGDDEAARLHLEAERAQFPEGGAFVDFLLKTRSKSGAPSTLPAAAAGQPKV